MLDTVTDQLSSISTQLPFCSQLTNSLSLTNVSILFYRKDKSHMMQNLANTEDVQMK